MQGLPGFVLSHQPVSAADSALLGMASPEQVSRRVDRAEQDITAISDTVLDRP
ncbi:MAG: hypothetical protein ACRDTJ_30305 [Pseudonocardiaceae bacterium]